MKNEIIMILGSGRSGTSLLTSILISMGMSTSDNLKKASIANPKGAFEDSEIFDLQRKIYDLIGLSGYAPIPADSFNNAEIYPYIDTLKKIVGSRIDNAGSTWGFKDPKTASLLPIWHALLDDIGVSPKYVISVRDPSKVALSMNRYYKDSFDVAEIAWLIRTCEALYYTEADCFIVHFDDWFTDKAEAMVCELMKYTGLGSTTDKYSAKRVLASTVSGDLNRTSGEYDIKHPLVRKLYSILKTCHGNAFDRDELMQVVRECRANIIGFSPFLHMNKKDGGSAGVKAKNKVIQRLESKASMLQKEVNVLKNDNMKLVNREGEQHKELISLSDKLESMKINSIDLSANLNKLNKEVKSLKGAKAILEKEIFIQKVSVSFRIGQVFVKAVKSPGMNTILLPYKLLKILLETVFVRKNL